MKRVNLTKYGFIRWPEEDFSNDGNRFTCYKAGKSVRVTKLVADGEAYLSAEVSRESASLPYEVYSKLPHYTVANWEYNGVSVESLTEEDIQNFYKDCIEYEKEFEAAEASMTYPTLEELKAKTEMVHAQILIELNKIEQLFAAHGLEAAMKLSSYEWTQVQEYIKKIMVDEKRYNPETYPQTLWGKAQSFSFLKSTQGLEESYWFIQIKEFFKRHLII